MYALSDETKSSTLDDLNGQYCNRNCIGCSAPFLATAGLSCKIFYWHILGKICNNVIIDTSRTKLEIIRFISRY